MTPTYYRHGGTSTFLKARSQLIKSPGWLTRRTARNGILRWISPAGSLYEGPDPLCWYICYNGNLKVCCCLSAALHQIKFPGATGDHDDNCPAFQKSMEKT